MYQGFEFNTLSKYANNAHFHPECVFGEFFIYHARSGFTLNVFLPIKGRKPPHEIAGNSNLCCNALKNGVLKQTQQYQINSHDLWVYN